LISLAIVEALGLYKDFAPNGAKKRKPAAASPEENFVSYGQPV